MTPFTQLSIETHIQVYRDQVSEDIHRSTSSRSPIRRAFARGLVRTGAWLLPDKPDKIGDTVIVLAMPPLDTPRKAAA
jgi:hypothetical protein